MPLTCTVHASHRLPHPLPKRTIYAKLSDFISHPFKQWTLEMHSGGAANFTMLQSLSMSTQSKHPYALCRLPCAYVTLHITILRVHHISFHVLCPKGWCRIKPISHCPLGRGWGDDVMLAQCVHSGGAANFTMLCSHSPSAIYKSLLSAIMKKLNSGLIDV